MAGDDGRSDDRPARRLAGAPRQYRLLPTPFSRLQSTRAASGRAWRISCDVCSLFSS
jgi:hypothetical protein